MSMPSCREPRTRSKEATLWPRLPGVTSQLSSPCPEPAGLRTGGSLWRPCHGPAGGLHHVTWAAPPHWPVSPPEDRGPESPQSKALGPDARLVHDASPAEPPPMASPGSPGPLRAASSRRAGGSSAGSPPAHSCGLSSWCRSQLPREAPLVSLDRRQAAGPLTTPLPSWGNRGKGGSGLVDRPGISESPWAGPARSLGRGLGVSRDQPSVQAHGGLTTASSVWGGDSGPVRVWVVREGMPGR